MKKLFSGRVKLLMLAAVLIAVLYAILSALFGSLWPERLVQGVMNPLRSGVSAITRQVERYYNYVFSYESLQAENDYLRSRIAEMEKEMRDAAALERENRRYEALLQLQEKHIDYEMTASYIISWDSSDWKSAFTINKGTDDGLSEGQIVITELGQVVGTITDIGGSWATVTTILDSSMEVSASIASSGYTGVVQGALNSADSGMLRMSYLPSNAVLRNNDQVVTTGSAVYPKDLILGYIYDAGSDETGLSKYATLLPACEFDGLEQVFIVTQFTPR